MFNWSRAHCYGQEIKKNVSLANISIPLDKMD